MSMKHAPPKIMGLGIPYSKLEQEVSKLNAILKHGPDNTKKVFFLQSNMWQAQVFVCLGTLL